MCAQRDTTKVGESEAGAFPLLLCGTAFASRLVDRRSPEQGVPTCFRSGKLLGWGRALVEKGDTPPSVGAFAHSIAVF